MARWLHVEVHREGCGLGSTIDARPLVVHQFLRLHGRRRSKGTRRVQEGKAVGAILIWYVRHILLRCHHATDHHSRSRTSMRPIPAASPSPSSLPLSSSSTASVHRHFTPLPPPPTHTGSLHGIQRVPSLTPSSPSLSHAPCPPSYPPAPTLSPRVPNRAVAVVAARAGVGTRGWPRVL